jgi:hypothetical protein
MCCKDRLVILLALAMLNDFKGSENKLEIPSSEQRNGPSKVNSVNPKQLSEINFN